VDYCLAEKAKSERHMKPKGKKRKQKAERQKPTAKDRKAKAAKGKSKAEESIPTQLHAQHVNARDTGRTRHIREVSDSRG
jgi:hypothetical protein